MLFATTSRLQGNGSAAAHAVKPCLLPAHAVAATGVDVGSRSGCRSMTTNPDEQPWRGFPGITGSGGCDRR